MSGRNDRGIGQEAAKALNEAVAEARHNPETARSLFAVASYGRRDPASLK